MSESIFSSVDFATRDNQPPSAYKPLVYQVIRTPTRLVSFIEEDSGLKESSDGNSSTRDFEPVSNEYNLPVMRCQNTQKRVLIKEKSYEQIKDELYDMKIMEEFEEPQAKTQASFQKAKTGMAPKFLDIPEQTKALMLKRAQTRISRKENSQETYRSSLRDKILSVTRRRYAPGSSSAESQHSLISEVSSAQPMKENSVLLSSSGRERLRQQPRETSKNSKRSTRAEQVTQKTFQSFASFAKQSQQSFSRQRKLRTLEPVEQGMSTVVLLKDSSKHLEKLETKEFEEVTNSAFNSRMSVEKLQEAQAHRSCSPTLCSAFEGAKARSAFDSQLRWDVDHNKTRYNAYQCPFGVPSERLPSQQQLLTGEKIEQMIEKSKYFKFSERQKYRLVKDLKQFDSLNIQKQDSAAISISNVRKKKLSPLKNVISKIKHVNSTAALSKRPLLSKASSGLITVQDQKPQITCSEMDQYGGEKPRRPQGGYSALMKLPGSERQPVHGPASGMTSSINSLLLKPKLKGKQLPCDFRFKSSRQLGLKKIPVKQQSPVDKFFSQPHPVKPKKLCKPEEVKKRKPLPWELTNQLLTSGGDNCSSLLSLPNEQERKFQNVGFRSHVSFGANEVIE